MKMQMATAHAVMPTNRLWNHSPNKGAEIHVHKTFFEPLSDGRDVNRCVAHDYARGLPDDLLSRVEHAHDNRPGVGHDEDCARALEHPLEKDRRLDLVEVVAVGHYLD